MDAFYAALLGYVVGSIPFGLLLTILGAVRHRPDNVPAAVALYIVAGYWFTSSTSFANPAIAVARSLSNSFAGIAPHDVPLFIVSQLAGALAAYGVGRVLFAEEPSEAAPAEGPKWPIGRTD